MHIHFIGHACFYLEGQAKIIIDPFISGNPAAVQSVEEFNVDYILLSHAHGDHLGDALQIAKRTGAVIVSVYEVATYCSGHGAKTHAMHIGGSHRFGDIRIKLTPALHGSSVVTEDGRVETLGNPCGFIINMNGKTIYHSGDTGLFSDMGLIGKFNDLDLALLPIGDNFTMGPEDALEAVRFLNPKTVIPMHYNTWPLIEQDAGLFKNNVEKETMSQVVILKPGKSCRL
jgi:L-ascorbate metabolism protein UlaG (beta-lactamase superfamily)